MSNIPDAALWAIINAIRQGCGCKECARNALTKALQIIEGAGKPNLYTTGAVWTNPTTTTNKDNNGIG